MRAYAAFVLFAFGLAGCAPSVVRVNSDAIGRLAVTKVFVFPFEGDPEFASQCTNIFVAELEPRISASIVRGSELHAKPIDVLPDGNLASTELALAEAKEAGAQVLITGLTTSYIVGSTAEGFSTVRIINDATGETLASFHRASGKPIVLSVRRAVMAAAKRTAIDAATVLK